MDESRTGAALADERGSAPAEFVMVGSLVVVLVLMLLQLAFALHVRNTVTDAAAEGARFAALAGNDGAAGEARTRDLISTALAPPFAESISARRGEVGGVPVISIEVAAPLPLIGPFGLADGMEVAGHAPIELLPE